MKSKDLFADEYAEEPVVDRESEKTGGFDWTVFSILLAIVIVGLIITPSAGYFKVLEHNTSYTRYLIDHIVRVMVGIFVAFIFYLINPRALVKSRFVFIGFSTVFLILVLLLSPYKYHRWLVIGPVTFQPSEFAKLAVLLFITGFTAKGLQRKKSIVKNFLNPMIFVGINAILILVEPNVSTSIILVTIATAQLFVGGLRLRSVFVFAAFALVLTTAGIKFSSNARERFENFISRKHLKKGEQVYYAVQAIKNGGFVGVGIGGGSHKFFYLLRQADTDFVYAVIGEEMGFVGTAGLLFLFLALYLLVVKRIIRFYRDMEYRVLAFGIAFTFVLYALINMATSLGFIPATGVPMPFVSYGGSAMMINMALAGILLRILKEKNA